MLRTGNRDGLRTLQPVPEGSDRGPDARAVAITERAGVPAGLDHQGRGAAGARRPRGDGVPHHHHARPNRPAYRAPLRPGLRLRVLEAGSHRPPARRSGLAAGAGRDAGRAGPGRLRPDPHLAVSAGEHHRLAPRCPHVRRRGGRDLPGVHLPHALPARQGTGTPSGRGHPRPRSGYVLSGAARYAWQHSIPPTKALRYSITFRTLKAS